MSKAEQLRAEGNAQFKGGNFLDAIDLYSRAIQHDSQNAVLFTNRALCHIQLGHHEQAVQDCQKAVELAPERYKGHYLLGQSQLELGRFQAAKRHLTTANELVRGQDAKSSTQVLSALRQAKKKLWEESQKNRQIQHDEHHAFLMGAIETYFEQQFSLVDSDASLSDAQRASKHDDLSAEKSQRLSATFALFEQHKEEYQPRNVPDYVCCKISFEVMKDPVITPSGITYDRPVIVEHLQRVGHFDPVSRAPLTEAQLVHNLAIKEVIDEFLQKNSWVEAFEMD